MMHRIIYVYGFCAIKRNKIHGNKIVSAQFLAQLRAKLKKEAFY